MAFFRWTGIDLGSHSIKILQLIPQGKKFKLANFLVFPREELTAHGEDLESMSLVLLDKLQEHQLGSSAVVMAITSKEGIIRYTRIPPVPPWRLKIIMGYEISEMAGKAGSEITADYFNLDLPGWSPQDSMQDDMLALVSMAKNDLVQENIHLLEGAKMGVKKVMPSCIALFNTFKWLADWDPDGPQDGPVLLLDLGANNTDITLVFHGQLLFARSISLGGTLFTKSIQDSLGWSQEKAEKAKVTQGSLRKKGTPPKIWKALQEGGEHFAAILNTSLGFCRSQLRQPSLKISKILITGGGSKLSGLPGFLEKQLGIEVRRFDFVEGLDLSSFKGKARDKVEELAPQLASVVGLALCEHSKAISLNLLPYEYQQKREFKSRSIFMIGSALMIGFYIVLSMLVALSLRSKTTAQNQKVQDQLSKSQFLVGELRKLREKNSQNLKVRDALTATSRNLYFAVQLLTFFNQQVPDGVYLRNFKFVPGESKDGKYIFMMTCYADNSNHQAPSRIKGIDQKLDQLAFVVKTTLSGGQSSRRNQFELKYTLKIECGK